MIDVQQGCIVETEPLLNLLVFNSIRFSFHNLKYSEIVNTILNSGYINDSNIPLSEIIHEIIEKLIISNKINRLEDENMVRTYKIKG